MAKSFAESKKITFGKKKKKKEWVKPRIVIHQKVNVLKNIKDKGDEYMDKSWFLGTAL